MAIINAAVEANGWVLRITLTATPGTFATYALTPDAVPKVSLTTNHTGYAPAAGIAVATTLARTLVATKPLRKPVNIASPTTPVLDEIDNGDGSVTVRLALSDWVHATDTGLALTVLPGWRSGEAAAGPIAVGNGSTVAAALPIMRWADVPYQRATGPFTLELIVFSHHPQGAAPVAGVRFRVTDGTTTRIAWATALSTSTRYGDNVRVYAASFDPGAATAMTAGLLRCDAEVYPWLGNMRSTDAAGTVSMTGLNLQGYGSKAETPFVMGYDPVGTRYGGQVLFIDPLGTVTATAAMVTTDLATAKAIAPASRPRDISTAIQALYLVNRSMPAANGGVSAVRSADGARLVLAAGSHAGVGTTTVTGTSSTELGVIIEGDPDDPSPRVNCVLATGVATGVKTSRLVLRNLTLEVGTTALVSTAQVYFWFDNVEIRGKLGQETNSVAPVVTPTPASGANLAATRSRWWKSSSAFRGTTLRFGLLRNCEFSRRAEGICVIGGRFMPATEDPSVTNAENGAGNWNSTTDIGAVEDSIVAGVDIRSIKGRAWVITQASAAAAGTSLSSVRRAVFANNLCERIGADPQPFFSTGEDASMVMSYNIIEGNSFIGERCNLLYSDPVPGTVAETNSQFNIAFGNRVANNSFDWAATKHDAFNDPTTLAVRTSGGVPSPTGYRPQMTETWSVTYGVGWEANHDFGRLGGGNFAFEYFGRRSTQLVGGVPAWPVDRSNSGSPTTGGGSYKPPAGSVLLGRVQRASVDRDMGGATRLVPFAIGAVDGGGTLALAPAKARSTTAARVVTLGWAGILAPVAARSLNRAGSSALGWRGVLGLASGHLVLRAGVGALGIGGVVVGPVSTRQTVRDAGAAVLPDLPFELLFGAPRLVRIAGELRVQFVAQD